MTQSKEEKVHQVFETIYQKYDQMNSIISFQRHVAWRKDTMKRMDVQKGDHALDVCCGTADWTIALGQAVGSDGKVYGLDFSKNMLSIGQEKIEGVSQIELIHGNAMELPFEDGQFDFVTIGFGLRNVPDYVQVLKEMYRVLKPGGKAVCLETSHPTAFGFKQVYYFYFKYLMPLLGKLVAKSYSEYSWLQESTMAFPNKEKLAELFKEAGFADVQIKSYSGGAAAMHLGVK